MLVLGDIEYPGWKATIDGEPARIYPTDVALRSVMVPAGTSTVRFAYRPRSFSIGVLIGFLTVLILLLYGMRRGRPGPRTDQVPRSTEPPAQS
jgi:uncharacterized membrane protein YfhO